jgi:hypothetical protein
MLHKVTRVSVAQLHSLVEARCVISYTGSPRFYNPGWGLVISRSFIWSVNRILW